MKFRNLGIGKRLGIAFGVILTVQVLFVVLVGYLNITNKNSLIEDINYVNAKTVTITNMRGTLSKISISIRNIGLQSDIELMKKEQEKVVNGYKDYDTYHKKLLRLNLTEEEKTIMKNIDDKNEQSIKLFEEAMKNILSFNTEGAIKIISTKIDPLSEEMKIEINKIVEKEEKALKNLLKSSVVDDNNLLIGLSIGALIEIIIASLVAFVITRSITKPLNSAVKIANIVAAGDLTQSIEVNSTDETGQLLQALQNMNTSLKKIVSEVRIGTDMISTASSEIASGNMDLSHRTEQQAGSLEETASSMEELTSTVKGNTANAQEANKLALSASKIAIKGGEVVSNVVTTMGSINDSSKKIVDIISVIDGIAFQTNILALNAAVEAARAGEQGRGFAVVASEVGNLAQRSANAAKEIKELINDSVSKVTIGRQLVDQAGQTMNEIVTSVKHVTDIMGEITMASKEQEAGIEQVNRAINEMDTVTQQNAALVEEAAAAAQSLNDQADNLSQVVSVFKV